MLGFLIAASHPLRRDRRRGKAAATLEPSHWRRRRRLQHPKRRRRRWRARRRTRDRRWSGAETRRFDTRFRRRWRPTPRCPPRWPNQCGFVGEEQMSGWVDWNLLRKEKKQKATNLFAKMCVIGACYGREEVRRAPILFSLGEIEWASFWWVIILSPFTSQ